jgi:hypothetical protein
MSEQPPTAVELADSILRTYEAVIATGEAVQRHAEETESEVARLWRAIAELRDDQHEGLSALSNRLQNLTTAVTTEPAEVAHAIFRPRQKLAFCTACEQNRPFTEGKCDYCGTGFTEVAS